MLDRTAVQKEYSAWRTGTELNRELVEVPTFEWIDGKSPAERRRYYALLRNKALRFALVIRLAIEDNVLDTSALEDIQHGMSELRKWYYAMPQHMH